MNKIRFISQNDIIAAGYGGAIYVSHDRGETWEDQTLGGLTSFNNIAVVGGTVWLLGEQGAIYKSINPLPVELTVFRAALENKRVKLNWETATEVNNYGFEIEKSSVSADALPDREVRDQKAAGNWVKVGFVKGSGNSNSVRKYTFVDDDVSNGKYVYRLKQIDNNGTFKYSKEVELKVNLIPTKYSLSQNYPNPFNPVTNINYTLPYASMVKLTLYNINGEEVKRLVNGVKESGAYTVKLQSNDLSSGVYFYKLEAVSTQGKGEYAASRKLLILK